MYILIFFLFIFQAFADKPLSPELTDMHVENLHLIDKFSLKYGLKMLNFNSPMEYIDRMLVYYEGKKNPSIIEARKILLDIVDTTVKQMHTNPKLSPFVRKPPFKRTDLAIMIIYPNTDAKESITEIRYINDSLYFQVTMNLDEKGEPLQEFIKEYYTTAQIKAELGIE